MEPLTENDKEYVMERVELLMAYLEGMFADERLRRIIDSEPLNFHATDADYASPLGKILLKAAMYPAGVEEKDFGTDMFVRLLKLRGFLFENSPYFHDRIGWDCYWHYAYQGVADKIFEDNFQPSAWNREYPFRREK